MFVEPVEGWRAWQLYQHDGQWLLESIHYPGLWNPHEPYDAVCGVHVFSRASHVDHPAPDPHCFCGVYAATELAQIQGYIDGHRPDALRVFGRVKLWGRVIPHHRGWRAEHAYPASLTVPASTPELDRVMWDLTVYGIPVEAA